MGAIRRLSVVATLVLAAAGAVWACGPYFPDSFLIFGSELRILRMPTPPFPVEILDLTGPPPSPTEDMDLNYPFLENPADLQNKESADLTEALGTGADAGLVGEYTALRAAMHSYIHHPPVSLPMTEPHAPSEASDSTGTHSETETPTSPAPVTAPPADVHFDIAPYESMLGKLPPEFAAYTRGAAEYANKDWDGAVALWKKLVELPAEQRKYKSVWAAYMIGRARLATNQDEADAAFEQATRLASEGFKDSWGLSASALRWRVEIAKSKGRIASAIRLTADLCKQGNPRERAEAFPLLETVCDLALSGKDVPEEVVKDPLCRRLALAFMRGTEGTDKWAEALKTLPEDQRGTEAGYFAKCAYNSGNMDLAQRWVDAARPDDIFAQWVKAKLLMREGKSAEAAAILNDLAKALPDQPWYEDLYGDEYASPTGTGDLSRSYRMETSAELGILKLSLNDFVGALDAFLQGGYWQDAEYVAERVVTVDELKTYVDAHLKNSEWAKKEENGLRPLLAKRLARSKGYEAALPYYDDTTRDIAKKLIAELKEAKRKDLDASARADHFFAAAGILRDSGMEIVGTELAPDWHTYDDAGKYIPPQWYSRYMGQDTHYDDQFTVAPGRVLTRIHGDQSDPRNAISMVTPSPDELARVAQSAPKPDRRFHYKHVAAELMWQGAKILPDNDIRTAKALYDAGVSIKADNPKEADKFYKALVQRCGNLPIGQEAQKRHWFPPEFIP
jgi:hypothetical protein